MHTLKTDFPARLEHLPDIFAVLLRPRVGVNIVYGQEQQFLPGIAETGTGSLGSAKRLRSSPVANESIPSDTP